MDSSSTITGIVLAGGAGRRVGHRDKGLLPYRGKPLVAHVCERLAPQVERIIISCNRNLDQYRDFAATVVVDRRENYQGPLSGLESVAPAIKTDYVAIAPCDMPALPLDWVVRLRAAMSRPDGTNTSLCYAHDGRRAQYLCALMTRECLSTLGSFLDEGRRAVKEWYALHAAVPVDFSDQAEGFLNYNRVTR
jgi:molybdopterin-guanine dinucleotide biosynthesis protein A